MALRLAVISDLHLAADRPRMLSRTARLARFLDHLPSRAAADERLELLIAGDFVDFLATKPWASFTADPAAAVEKLERTIASNTDVFEALGRFLAGGHPCTVLVGNHDLELALPAVQDALLRHLGTDPHRLRLLLDGEAFRAGGLLVEHGNRYDGANANDQAGLRALASAASRGESPQHPMLPSPGSRLVERVINPLKERYPFLDLLKPQGALTALLLFAFEPALGHQVRHLAALARAGFRHADDPWRPGPHAHGTLPASDPELEKAFDGDLEALKHVHHHVPIHEWVSLVVRPEADGLAAILDRGESIPPARLHAIRVALRRLLLDDRSAAPDGPTGAWGTEAKRMIEGSGGTISCVVMGHTHLARHVGPPDLAWYVNTGTWADVVRVPMEAMEDGSADEALEAFLRALHRDERPEIPATWADLRVEADGRVSRARLESWS